LFLIFTVCVI